VLNGKRKDTLFWCKDCGVVCVLWTVSRSATQKPIYNCKQDFIKIITLHETLRLFVTSSEGYIKVSLVIYKMHTNEKNATRHFCCRTI
jgi:hypothetical protein